MAIIDSNDWKRRIAKHPGLNTVKRVDLIKLLDDFHKVYGSNAPKLLDGSRNKAASIAPLTALTSGCKIYIEGIREKNPELAKVAQKDILDECIDYQHSLEKLANATHGFSSAFKSLLIRYKDLQPDLDSLGFQKAVRVKIIDDFRSHHVRAVGAALVELVKIEQHGQELYNIWSHLNTLDANDTDKALHDLGVAIAEVGHKAKTYNLLGPV